MPILIIFGVPERQQSFAFIKRLKQRVHGMKELNLTEDDISIKFIHPSSGDTQDIIIFVEGLFKTYERNEKVRNELADRLAQCAKSYFHDGNAVECIIHPFERTLGFARII